MEEKKETEIREQERVEPVWIKIKRLRPRLIALI